MNSAFECICAPVKMKIWWRLQFLLLFCWQYRILFRRLRTFNSCNNFPNNHSPPCRLLSLSLLFSLRNHHQASNLLLWFTQISTFSFSSRLFSALPLSHRKIHSLFLSTLTKIFHSRNWKELSAGEIQFDAKQSNS